MTFSEAISSDRRKLLHFLLAGTAILLSSCVSYEPNRLTPSITLSPEQINLRPAATTNSDAAVDFGLTVTVNESDSLFNVEVLPGVRVRDVTPQGPAEIAGLQVGDVILSVDGALVNQPDTLDALSTQIAPDTPAVFRVRRDTTVLEANLIGRSRATAGAEIRELYRADPLASRAGYETIVMRAASGNSATAVRIVDIGHDSPLHAANISTGDVILTLDGVRIGSAQGLVTALLQDFETGRTVTLGIQADGRLDERRVRLWDPGRRVTRIGLRPLLNYESSLADDSAQFSFLDFWVFALYRFNRSAGERQHEILELFRISSDIGELTEETPER